MRSDTLPLKNILNESDFLKRAVVIQWNTWERYLLFLAKKLIEKLPDTCNASEHYESFLRNKNRELVKEWEMITYHPNNCDSADIKAVITEHSKTLHKSSKTIRQVEKVSSLYSDTKNWKLFERKKYKNNKREHALKCYVSAYNVAILNFFNPELQLKDIESAIKSKLIELLTQLRGFKFVTVLYLVFKKIESKDNTKCDILYSTSKAEMIINENEIENSFKSIYITVTAKIQKYLEKCSGWIVVSFISHTICNFKF